MADTVIFLELSFDGRRLVAGSAETTGFVDQIEIESFSWGAGANHNETNQRRASKDETPLKMQSVELSKFYDRASPQITTGAAQRRHVERALLSFISLPLREDGRAPARLMEMEMKDGFIERVRLQASESGRSIAIKDGFLDLLQRAEAVVLGGLRWRHGSPGPGQDLQPRGATRRRVSAAARHVRRRQALHEADQ